MHQDKFQQNQRTSLIQKRHLLRDINHLSFQDSYYQNELPRENEYNLFRDTLNQLSTDQDHDTYYTGGNYRNSQHPPKDITYLQ